jgi:large subunit ribosomal protein L5
MDQATLEKTVVKQMDKIIKIEKVVVNCSIGESGVKLEKASKIIEQLTNQKPILCKARKTIRSFGIHKGEPIAVKVTLRKNKAYDFLQKALKAIKNKIPKDSFDENGNVSFGISEHLDIPGTKYDPSLGIIGMDVCVSLCKPGKRISLRKRARSKVGKRQRVTKEEAMKFFIETFNVELI